MRWLAGLILLMAWVLSGEAFAADKMALWRNTDGPHLRGANIYQRRVYTELDGETFMGPGPVGPPFEPDDFRRLAASGANVVLISHPGLFSETPPYTLDKAIQDNLDRLLAMALDADLFAVIGFRTGPGRSEFTLMSEGAGDWFDRGYLNDRVWAEPGAQAGWVAMWWATAARYRTHKAVVGYQLMVEPNANDLEDNPAFGTPSEWDPEAFHERHGNGFRDWNLLYPRIVAAIREVDPDTPILVGGNGYSGAWWLPFLKPGRDRRSVYAVHQYEPYDYTHQDATAGIAYPGRMDVDGDGEDQPFDRQVLADLMAPLDNFTKAQQRPLAVTEFGVHRWAPGADGFLADQMAMLEARGINQILWEWTSSYPEFAAEVTGFNFRFGPDQTHRSAAAENRLLDVVRRSWARNTKRPSNTPF